MATLPRKSAHEMEVRAAGPVLVEEIPLLGQDRDAQRAFEVLRDGFTVDDYRRALELQPVATTRQRESDRRPGMPSMIACGTPPDESWPTDV